MISTNNKYGIVNWDDLEVDDSFCNFTDNDFILVFMDGTVKKGWSSLKVREMRNELCIQIGRFINSNLTPERDMIRCYNYMLYPGQYASGWVNYKDGPTPKHPVPYITDSVSMVLMIDDEWSRDLLTHTNPKEYAKSVIMGIENESSLAEADISYINLCDHDLFMASNGTIIKLPCFDKRNESDARTMNQIITNNGLSDIYNTFKDSYEIVVCFSKSTETDVAKNSSYKAKALLFEKDTYSSEYPLKPKETDENDLMMFFYTWEAADNFIKNVKNSTNYVIKVASDYFDEDKEMAVSECKIENKKNMISVAKVCASMIGTGVVFAGTKLIFDYIVNKKDGPQNKLMFNRIMRGINLRNMFLQSGKFKSAFAITRNIGLMGGTAACFTGCTFGGTAGTLGVASLACPPLAAGIGIVAAAAVAVTAIVKVANFVTDGGFSEKVSEILDKVEEVPILGAVVKGVRFVTEKVTDGIKWVGEKIVDGAKWIGSKISDGFSWVCDKIGGFFSNLFGI